MKRGLCCVCAVLVCTALVLAGSPARTMDSKTGNEAAAVARPAQSDATAVTGVNQYSELGGLSNRAPAGYVSTGGTWPNEATGRAHDFTCSPLASPEGEPLCGPEYIDAYNGGCNSTPAVFQNITCSAVILGQSGTYAVGTSTSRDTDWYQIVLTQPTKLTWNVMAEFPLLVFLIDGTQGCAALTLMQGATADPCKFAVVEKCVPAGTYWLWVGPSVFDGVTCGAQYCAQLTCEPCTVPAPIACPTGSYTNVWQLAYGEDEAWSLFKSNAPGQVKLFEHFAGVGTPVGGGGIMDIHWWGVSATVDDQGKLVQCPLEPGNFHVGFWGHDTFTNRPDYAAGELFGFDATGAALTKADTGHVYSILNADGSVDAAYNLWLWGADLPAPLTMFAGWITVQNLDNCAFWWAASPGPPFGTGGVHVFEDQSVTPPTHEDIDGDLSWCLTSDQIGPFTGACCDQSAGVCRNTTSDECVEAYDVFHSGLLCTQITCTAEVWACCSAGVCSMETPSDCTGAGGTWYRFYVCATTDPLYDPTAFGGVGNLKVCPPIEPLCPITCETPAAFSRGLAGGYLYISWDRGAGDQRYVIDSFTGWTSSTSKINKVKWWGNSAIVWDGPDCDFVNPAPFAIRFYHPSGTGPNYNNPAQVYDPINATWSDTGYGWTGSPELGAIDCYYASLNPTYWPGSSTQWISIASKTVDCDYIWAPGPDGTPGQWFYDNGTATSEGAGNRHRSFCLHTNIATGACCNELTGVCTNGVQETNCLAADGKVFYKAMLCAAIPGGCHAHQGACCNHNDGTCTITLSASCTGTGKIWLGRDSTCAQCCVVLCPAGGVPEGEPACGAEYVDTFNQGCFTDGGWTSEDFVQIADGQVICGKTGIFTVAGEGRRDLDFYRYELTDARALVQAKVNGEFTPDVWLMVGQCFTDTWCGAESTYVLVYSQGAADPCGDAIASAPVLGPNFFYIMVSCYGAVGEVPCQTPYTLEIVKDVVGCCTIGEDFQLRTQAVCLTLGGTWVDDVCPVAGGACCVGLDCTDVPDAASCVAPGIYHNGQLCASSPCGPPCMATADANCDGVVNTFDIDPFVVALTNPAQWATSYGATCQYLCAADCNGDGAVNTFDIDPFVICLTQGCP